MMKIIYFIKIRCFVGFFFFLYFLLLSDNLKAQVTHEQQDTIIYFSGNKKIVKELNLITDNQGKPSQIRYKYNGKGEIVDYLDTIFRTIRINGSIDTINIPSPEQLEIIKLKEQIVKYDTLFFKNHSFLPVNITDITDI